MAAPFEAGIKQLEELLHPTIGNDYKIRFWIQVLFCCILFVTCLVYLLLTYIDSRRTAKPVALFRIQRVASGRFIVVNALVFLVLLDGIAAILMLVLRYKIYSIYYGSGTPYNRLILGMISWLPLSLVAWAYSFGNISAMMQIRTRDYGGPSSRAVIAYNVAFFLTLFAALGVALPCCILANDKMNKILKVGHTLLDLLYKANTPGTTTSLEELATIKNLQASIASSRKATGVWVRVVLAIATAIAVLTAISATAAFWFVAFLSGLPNDEVVEPSAIARTPAFSQAPHEDHEITTFLGLGASPEILRPLSSSTQKTKSPSFGGHSRIQNIALKRLYNDLKLSVPVVLILSVYCLITGILIGFHMIDPDWKEILHDGMSWTSPVLLLIVLTFLYNLIKYRNSPPTSTSSHSRAIQLSRSPISSPRRGRGATGSFQLSSSRYAKQSEDGEDEGEYRIKRVEACFDPYRIRSDHSNVDIVH